MAHEVRRARARARAERNASRIIHGCLRSLQEVEEAEKLFGVQLAFHHDSFVPQLISMLFTSASLRT